MTYLKKVLTVIDSADLRLKTPLDGVSSSLNYGYYSFPGFPGSFDVSLGVEETPESSFHMIVRITNPLYLVVNAKDLLWYTNCEGGLLAFSI